MLGAMEGSIDPLMVVAALMAAQGLVRRTVAARGLHWGLHWWLLGLGLAAAGCNHSGLRPDQSLQLQLQRPLAATQSCQLLGRKNQVVLVT